MRRLVALGVFVAACASPAPRAQSARSPSSRVEPTAATATSTATACDGCAEDQACRDGRCELGGRRVALSGEFGCVIRPSGHVACWGANEHGQLGDGSTRAHASPVAVSGLADAVSIALGERTSYALRANGEVVAWGSNLWGECGVSGDQDDRLKPFTVPGVSNAIALDAGSTFACAVLASGELSCWGTQSLIALDAELRTGRASPRAVQEIHDALRVAIGSNQMCVLRRDRSVACWGNSAEGAIGDGTSQPRSQPTAVVGLDAAQALAAGRDSCALTSSGRVMCWGFNSNAGELGDGTTTSRNTPGPVSGLDAVRYVDTNGWTDGGCAVRTTGGVACWGLVANPKAWGRSVGGWLEPKPIPGVADALQVATTRWSACVLERGGKLACWGDASRLGRVIPHLHEPSATRVSELADAVHVSVGQTHACAVRRAGKVVCWGDNELGQRGDSSPLPSATPIEVAGVDAVVAISAASHHSCAVLRDGHVSCWGRNEDAELGDGTTEPRQGPVKVAGLADATRVAAGGSSTCALRRGGSVVCWGDLGSGRLTAPTAIKRLTRASDLFADGLDLFGRVDARYCAVEGGGTLACWGHGAKPDVLTARPIKGISDARAGLLDGRYGCVIRKNGHLACSLAIDEQLVVEAAKAPKAEVHDEISASDVVAVATGSNTTCVLRANGQVNCFGANFAGQVGDGSFDGPRGYDGPVSGVADARELSAGDAFFCALTKSGSVLCWGDNARGKLGNGQLVDDVVTTPVAVALPE